MTEVRVFDRVEDVSKLMGCNTRNVEYRWSIFRKYLIWCRLVATYWISGPARCATAMNLPFWATT